MGSPLGGAFSGTNDAQLFRAFPAYDGTPRQFSMAAQARIADVPQHQILLFMRVALTADPELPVPPVLYGGIERIIDILARGLSAKGHEVTLFAHPASRTAGDLVPWTGAASDSHIDTLRNSITLARRVYAGRYDLIHSFSRIAYMLPILPF